MRIHLKISLASERGEPFMGIGLVWLLREVAARGSISRASEEMGLSYSKALKIVNRLEKNLGRKLLIRKHGGCDRGGASLTPFGKKFIDEYDRMQAAVKNAAEKEFTRFRQRIKI
ncbi:MAG: LysR family transcriptional regulator [PVC group bacterium]